MGKSKKSSSTTEAPATGLSSFLLAQADAKDSALEDIFASSSGPSLAFQPKKPEEIKKVVPAPSPPQQDADMAEVVGEDEELSAIDSDASLEMPSSDEEEEDEEDGLEEAYAAKLAAQRLKAEAEGRNKKKRKAEAELDEDEDEEEEENDDSDEDEGPLDINDLVHESLGGKTIKVPEKKGKKEKQVDPKKAEKAQKRAEESPDERDARTIFIGNVPSDCSTSNSRKKALVRHVLQNPSLLAALPPNCPPLKLDSIRFRSIAFASKVFGRKANATGGGDGEGNSGEAGGRGRKRAKEWRENEGSDQRGVRGGYKAREEEPLPSTSKSGALTDAQKRRVAFIRGELNEHKAACNSYLVIQAFPDEVEGVEMAEVIRLLVEFTNNSIFDGFTLRADHVRPRSAAAVLAAAQMAAKPNPNLIDVPQSADAATYQITATEARRTLFVGGLDFAETEENVRKATEAVLVRERGEIQGRYVENVRIVRDASTGLGKGFCYVLLADEQCVDELLALPPGKNLKISKRKVRLERCKTSAAAARSKASARSNAGAPAAPGKPGSSKAPQPRRAQPLAAPRDPSASRSRPSTSASDHQAKLAEALAKLEPEERKKIKAIDPERLARRAEKKKQKVLSERFERKQQNLVKKGGAAAGAGGILGRESRAEERKRKEKKRIITQSKSSIKKKKQH
ncbi:uncharacterized protein JCM6883_005779 [Sporobolomyces salmoneus]|uniref:uncharacterized protein n=1 Tax=Sporobolomyces salmoneus TaxID=183962 RepID=UPI003174842B